MSGKENAESEDIVSLPKAESEAESEVESEARGEVESEAQSKHKRQNSWVLGCSVGASTDISILDAYRNDSQDDQRDDTKDDHRDDNKRLKNQFSLRDWWHQILRDHGRFNCYAFFLCLPSDTEALKYLRNFGKELDFLSDKNCLVIAVSKSDFKRLGLSKEGIWKASIREQVSNGYSVTIARRFNISFTDFPCLMLFEDIRSPKRIVFTFRDLSSKQIASQMRSIFALVQKARSQNVNPLAKLENRQKAEGFQKVGQTMLDKVFSFTGRTFEAAMETWIKNIV